jgi:hypothetical protein
MALYTFVLEQFHIEITRSRGDDTDSVVFGLQTGGQEFPIQSLSTGDVDEGDHAVNLAFRSVFIGDRSAPVAFVYEIFNGDTAKVSEGLATLGQRLLDKVVNQTLKTSGVGDTGFPDPAAGEGGADIPNPANRFEDTSNWSGIFLESILKDIGDLLLPDCDGFVAAMGIGRTKKQWDDLIAAEGGGILRRSLRYPGTDSPSGCGRNSDYTVTWSVTRERTSGPGRHSLREFLQEHEVKLSPGVRSLDPRNPQISVRDLMSLV